MLRQRLQIWDQAGMKIGFILTHDLVHNVLALYGVQACRKLLPLISIPYLARVLKPEGWGTVAFVISLGEFMALTIEFGFNLSATREIAQNRDSAERCGRIVSGVMASQCLLAGVAAGVVLLLQNHLPILRDHPSLVWAGLLYGIFQGLNPIWFFQGLERIRFAAAVEVIGKVCALGGLFLFVRRPEDQWQVLAVQAAPAFVSTAAGLWLALKCVRLCRPDLPLIRQTLERSWPMFLLRSAESLYGVGNAFVLGFFASPASVGYFSMAERISRAIYGFMEPIREVVFPRLSSLAKRSKQRAAKLAQIGSTLMIAGGVILGIGIYLFAPLIIRLAGAGSFTPAVTVLRILALLPPLMAVTYSVGVQWLLSQGREKVVTRIMLGAGVVNLLLAAALAPQFAQDGMALAVVSAETLVCVSLFFAVRRISPFWIEEAEPLLSGSLPEPVTGRLD
jgi:polysaccharide transporter, PST family